VIELVKQELHPGLELTGIVPCLYDSRMRLAREVLAELRRYFPAQVFRTPISTNVKLAESPSFAKTIFEYAPESIGARDFASLAHEVLTQEALEKAGPGAVPPSQGRKRGALESFASSVAAASRAPATELAPVAPTPRKRASKPRPERSTTAAPEPSPESPSAPGPRPIATALPAPTAFPPSNSDTGAVAAGTHAAAARRGRSKPASSS